MTPEQIIDEMRARAIFDVELTREEYMERVAARLYEAYGVDAAQPITSATLVEALKQANIALPQAAKFS